MRKKPGSTIVVRIPKGSTSKRSDSIQPSTPNLLAAYATTNSWPISPAVDEIVTTCPDRCARITGSTARVTFIGPNKLVSIWARTCAGLMLLEVAGVEVAGVVDQHIDATEPVDRGVDGRLRRSRGR